MGKTEDRRSKRSKRQKPARFASPESSTASTPPATVAKSNVVTDANVVTTELIAPSTIKSSSTSTIKSSSTSPIKSSSTSTIKSSSTSTTTVQNDKSIEIPTQRARPAPSTKAAPVVSSPAPSSNAASTKKTRKRRNSDTSSDEERWLNAIEKGKLEDVDDELKKIKDPKLMTARQRAMYERTQDTEPALAGFVEELIALPSGYREKEKPQTAEEIQKAALKSQKRKQQADERREKDKQKTMERLLKKQESSKQRSAARNRLNQKDTRPLLTYINTLNEAYIIVPPGYEFPLKPQTTITPPKRQLCGVSGCRNAKVYSCSKTNIPLCSLSCYRKNLGVV